MKGLRGAGGPLFLIMLYVTTVVKINNGSVIDHLGCSLDEAKMEALKNEYNAANQGSGMAAIVETYLPLISAATHKMEQAAGRIEASETKN